MAQKTVEKPETEELEEHEKLGFKWVKGESGNTYLCPLDTTKNIEHLTEEQLKSMCVNESLNPHND
jgi:hypothetical protein